MNEKIDTFVSQAEEFTEEQQIERWQGRVETYLCEALGQEEAKKFSQLGDDIFNVFKGLSRQLGFLEALSGRLKKNVSNEETEIVLTEKRIKLSNKKVFVVHGHDNEAKETVSRFIEKIDLKAIVLHEQPNEGLTIVEKFEQHADVAFAVVLLTPDDIGAPANEPDNVQKRARQNVVLELGYFLASLGRKRVCALYKGNIEIPSDYQGVLYVEMDNAGAWKNKLAQEFVRAHIDVDLSGLL